MWIELCENPAAVAAYYTLPPSLERFEVVEALLMHLSPSLHLSGTVPVPPDKAAGRPPDAVGLTLAFHELSELSIEGYPADAVGPLKITAGDGKRVAFDFRSERMTCRGTARSVMIDAIAPRTAARPAARGPRLVSYPNVWNSCLLLARAKGFSVRLTGEPDERGSASRCRWEATKDGGTELTAANPVELAGLIALHEHKRPSRDEPYWWRIEGPELLQELLTEWQRTYFGPEGPGPGR